MKIQVLFPIILFILLPLLSSAQVKQRNGIRLAYGMAHMLIKDSNIEAQPKHYLGIGIYFPFEKKRLSGRVELNYESKGYFDKGKNNTVNFEYIGPSVFLCYAHLQTKAQISIGGNLSIITAAIPNLPNLGLNDISRYLDIGLATGYSYKILSSKSSELILESRIGYGPFAIYSNQARNGFASIGLRFGW